MSARHTPGPWVASVTFPIDNATVFAEAEFDDIHSAPIAYCTDHIEQRRPVAEAQANALLIAAAPELLAALKMLVENPTFDLGAPKVAGRVAASDRTAALALIERQQVAGARAPQR